MMVPEMSPANGRILIADSDFESRAFYANCLRRVVAEIDEAGDGCEALIKTVIRRPTLLLTDTKLSGFSGIELCDALRSHRDTADIPIVVLTEDVESAEFVRAREAGADSTLVKPFAPSVLISEVRRLIERSQMLRGRAQEIRVRAAGQMAKSDNLHQQIRRQRHRMLSKTFARFGTSKPPLEPPALTCPGCLKPLRYDRSHVGGVSEKHLEQWDYYECPSGCGTFQFRQRTHRLRQV